MRNNACYMQLIDNAENEFLFDRGADNSRKFYTVG